MREHFFGPDPRLQRLVAHLSDSDIEHLRRGGHDYRKVYAAYKAATEFQGAPTVILAKTVKGWTLGKGDRVAQLSRTRPRRCARTSCGSSATASSCRSPTTSSTTTRTSTRAPDSPEVEYMIERRATLGGSVPRRVVRAAALPEPEPAVDAEFASGSTTEVSTTMVFARLLRNLIRDPGLGKRIVPIVPDEARTFGLDPLFKEVGIYAAHGQRYTPVDSDLLLSYRESIDGQVLEEGINEAGLDGHRSRPPAPRMPPTACR